MNKKEVAVANELDLPEAVPYYKSQPNALNLAQNAIPEHAVWDSTAVVYDEDYLNETDKPTDGLMLEIDLGEVKPPVPPDGGWGWCIVLGSFLCMFLVDGVCFSYGIFLSELESTFGASKMQMTLAGSLLTGCYFMVGPVASGLMNRFGARALVIVGSIFSSLAILGSSFATDVNTFIGVFGVLGGIGYGLLYLPAATIVTTWFFKKRATVTGIVTAGSGIGVTCYSLAIPHLIEAYTWRGCILLLAAINLNAVVAGALFRPLVLHQSLLDRTRESVTEKSPLPSITEPADGLISASTKGIGRGTVFPKPVSLGRITLVKQLAKQQAESDQDGSHGIDDNPAHSSTVLNEGPFRRLIKRDTSKKSNTSWDNIIITHGNQLVPVPEGSALPTTSTERIPMLSVEAVNRIAEEVLNRQAIVSTTSLAMPADRINKRPSTGPWTGSQRWFASTASQIGQVTVRPTDTAIVYLKPDTTGSASYFASAVSLRTPGDPNAGVVDENVVREAIVKELQKEVARPGHRKDLFLGGSLMQINEYLLNPDVDSYIRNVTRPAEEIHARNPAIAMIRSMFGLSILRSPTFQLLNLSSILTMIGYIVPYQFLKDNAHSLGFAETDSSYLLAYLGIANTLSRVLSGFLSDQPWANVLLINNISLVVSGALTALVPLFTSYGSLLFYACTFGFIIAAFIAVRTILIVKLLGMDRLTNAYGFSLLFQGIAIVGAPPLLGACYDAFHTFHFIFIFGGVSVLISGLLCLPLARLSHWEQSRQEDALRDLESDENDDISGVEDESKPSMKFRFTNSLRHIRDRFRQHDYHSTRDNHSSAEMDNF